MSSYSIELDKLAPILWCQKISFLFPDSNDIGLQKGEYKTEPNKQCVKWNELSPIGSEIHIGWALWEVLIIYLQVDYYNVLKGKRTKRYVWFTLAQGWKNRISQRRAGIEPLSPIDYIETAASDVLEE